MRRTIAIAALLVAACTGGDAEKAPAVARGPMNPDPAQNTYAPQLGVDLSAFQKAPQGTLYRDVTVGTGAEASYNHEAQMRYAGWLPDGTPFDSGQYAFVVGAHEVIKGWEDGIPGMKVGGTRTLVIPAALGYGKDGSPPDIPPDAVLVFRVELLGVK